MAARDSESADVGSALLMRCVMYGGDVESDGGGVQPTRDCRSNCISKVFKQSIYGFFATDVFKYEFRECEYCLIGPRNSLIYCLNACKVLVA